VAQLTRAARPDASSATTAYRAGEAAAAEPCGAAAPADGPLAVGDRCARLGLWRGVLGFAARRGNHSPHERGVLENQQRNEDVSVAEVKRGHMRRQHQLQEGPPRHLLLISLCPRLA